MLEFNTSSCGTQAKELQGEYISAQQFLLHYVRLHTLAIRSDLNALWHPSKNPGGEAAAMGIRLGSVERALLQFMTKHMNDSGDPLFSKQTYIARCLHTTRSSLLRAMGSLESKGLIRRLHMNWNHRIRTILVPMGFHGHFHLGNFAPIPQSCRRLLQIFSDFNDLNQGVISFKSIKSIPKTSSKTQKSCRLLRVGNRWQHLLQARSREMKIQRSLVNPKLAAQVATSSTEPLIPVDRSRFQRRTVIAPDHYHMSWHGFKEPSRGRKTATFDRWEARIKEMLTDLCRDGVYPEYEKTRALLKSWRARIDGPKYEKFPIDETHPRWARMLVVVTHRLRYDDRADFESMKEAIHRLANWGMHKPFWAKMKKWNPIAFYLDIDNRWLGYFLDEDEIEFTNYIYEVKPKYVKARANFEITFRSVLDTHEPSDLSHQLHKYKNMMTKFVDQMVGIYQFSNRITYSLPLFQGGRKSLIGKYLNWLDENIWENGRIRMSDIPNWDYWYRFVEYFRNEYEDYPDLWQIKEKPEED